MQVIPPSNTGFLQFGTAAIPLIKYAANDLTGSSWINSGRTGNVHDMTIVGSPQLITAATANSVKFVHFDGNGHYETNNVVPDTLLGNASRTLGIRVLFEDITATFNVVGFGQAGSGQCFDLYNGSSQINIHNYGFSYGGPLVVANSFMDIAVIENNNNNNNLVSFTLNSVLKTPVSSGVLTTLVSKLRVGTGTYTAIDNTARFSISGVFVEDRVCSVAEINTFFLGL